MATPQDPWSALQASGDAATNAPTGIAPAYATFDDRNQPVVGFDLAMKLPPLCVKCGGAAETEEVMPYRVDRALFAGLAAGPNEAARTEAVRPGRLRLRLPYCTACAKKKKLAIGLRTAKYTAPLSALILVVIAILIHESLVGPTLLALLVLVPALFIFAGRMWSAGMVDVDRLDSEGFIRLVGVHPEVGEAIVAASGVKPSA
jgi:hypothetical protein